MARIPALFAVLTAVMLLSATWGYAQTVTGSITGTITDTDGLVVPNANVVATNVNTGVESNTTSNKRGVYAIRFLPIGNYQITISAKGFATQKFPAITLEIGKVAKVNAQLQVGSATSTVRVNAGAQLLNTHDATLGITLNSKEIEKIPLNGDNFSTVTLFEPGAVDTQPSAMSGFSGTMRNTTGAGVVSENGNRFQENNYLIDGIPMNQIYNNLIGYNPAPDAIEAVKVVAANGSAQNGDAAGGETLVQLKSGTSHFHGVVYEHYKNQNLDANTWANKHQNPIIPRTKFSQSLFGGALGGPILPKRLFFFADYAATRIHSGGIGTATVLTAAMRKGDFSELLHPPNGARPVQLYDTQNNFAPYPNNQIPIVNPVAQFLFAHPSLYPLPNATPTSGYLNGNYQGPKQTINTRNQFDVKLDWTPESKDSINGFFAYSVPRTETINPLVLSFPPIVKYPTYVLGTEWVHVFSPAIVNSAHFGFTIVNWNNRVPIDRTGVFGTSGDSKVGIPLPFQQTFQGFTSQAINGINNVGNNANPQGTQDTQYYYDDDLTWQHGKQLFSMGVQLLKYEENYPASGGDGYLGVMHYTGKFTSNPNVASGGTGYGPADFLLNRITKAAVAKPAPSFDTRQWRPSFYFEDDWTATPKLTVTLGLRYTYYQPWYETTNRVDNIVQSGPNKGAVEYASSVPTGAPPGSIACSNRACYQAVFDQLEPRIGVAYQLTHQLVIRGGYGATTDQAGNLANIGGPPFQSFYNENALVPTKTSGGTPFTVQDGFTGSTSKTTYAGFGAIASNYRPAYVKQYSLAVGYAINQNTSLNIAYVGETATNLRNYRNLNQLTAPGAPAPYANLVGQTGGLFETLSNAVANYNALQSTLRQRTVHGFSYTLNYTYGRSLSDASGFYGTPGIAGQGGPQNGYDPMGSYGASDLDLHNTFNGIFSYDLPFGQGREFAAHLNRVANELIGGWDLSGSVVAYSGYPVTISGPSENNMFSYGSQRANQYRPLVIHNRSLQHWFGTAPSATGCTQPGVDNGQCAYGTAAIGTFGTAAVNTQRAPGYHQIDASIFKHFNTFRAQVLTFRLDDFNVGNISSYGHPQNNISSPTFGLINSVVSPPQELQLSLNYKF